MSEPTRHDLNQFLCSRCNQPDAELSGMMVSCDNGRWVSYEDYARLKAEVDSIRKYWKATGESVNRYVRKSIALEDENARLKAEINRHVKARYNDDMAMSEKEDPLLIPRHLVVWWMDECKKAQAEVERLTKAGDAFSYAMDSLAVFANEEARLMARTASLAFKDARDAAKEGKTDA
jgi:hypothetical protein